MHLDGMDDDIEVIRATVQLDHVHTKVEGIAALLTLNLILTIYKWDFGAIPVKNDTTVILYPFAFAR
ncbi:MAG TPA: hypothetical protein VLX68_16125 [Chitinivibrionales bacterium]|nr:hypothetical protein [Chitinivibrionales bacterium]